MGWVQYIITSFGLKRRLSVLFQLLSTIAIQVPVLVPFAPILDQIAAWLGLAGITHAVAAKTVSTNPLSTLAAFFSALEIATAQVPVLAPYATLVHFLAVVFSLLATGSAVGGGKG